MKTMDSRATALACSLALLGALAWARDEPIPKQPADSIWTFLIEKYDADADGVITRKEYSGDDEHWARLDVDGDGKLARAEVEGRKNPNLRGKQARGRKLPKAPKVGSHAPDFELEVVVDVSRLGHAKEAGDKPKKPETVRLSAFRGKRPVALIFGSYT